MRGLIVRVLIVVRWLIGGFRVTFILLSYRDMKIE